MGQRKSNSSALSSEAVHSILLERCSVSLPYLENLFQKNGLVYLEKQDPETLHHFLVRLIIHQQIAKHAANAIWKKFEDSLVTSGMELVEFCRNEKVLRDCGLSRQKILAVSRLANSFEHNEISPQTLKNSDYPSIVSQITNLWGFGIWSADMVAIFFCGFPDIWSDADSALRKGLTIIAHNDRLREDEVLEKLTPYKSYLSLHIWRGLDTGVIDNGHI